MVVEERPISTIYQVDFRVVEFWEIHPILSPITFTKETAPIHTHKKNMPYVSVEICSSNDFLITNNSTYLAGLIPYICGPRLEENSQ